MNPDVTRERVHECLVKFDKGDNHLVELNRAYKLRVDTGWDVPPGVLRAPGRIYQSVLFGDHTVPTELLWETRLKANMAITIT